MSQTATLRFSGLPWTFRQVQSARLPLPVVGATITLAFLAVMLVLNNAVGSFQGIRYEGRPFWLSPFGWLELIYAVLFGYLPLTVPWALRSAAKQLGDLRPSLTTSPAAVESLREQLGAVSRRQLCIAGCAGLLLVLGADLLFFAHFSADLRPEPWTWWVVWGLAKDVILYWLAMRGFVIFLHIGRRFSQLGEHSTAVHLFDLRPLAPFARVGLRLSLILLVGWAIMIPVVVSFLPMAPGPEVLISAVFWFLPPVAIALLLLLIPMRGVHRAISAAKDRQLERVRAEIDRESAASLDRDEEGSMVAAVRLPGLLAYEARVAGVREWPFDLPALVRFVLYLAIPLASWVAAAFVERALGFALD